jgi:hypothetical protein
MSKPSAKIDKSAADWGTINSQSRLAIPAEVTDCLSWFSASLDRIDVLVDLSHPKLITIRRLDEVKQTLDAGRDALVLDSESSEIGLRRVALSHHFFRLGTLIPSARRIGLKSAILDHLGTKPGGRLFCLGFSDRIEAYNETAAQEIMSAHADDIVL